MNTHMEVSHAIHPLYLTRTAGLSRRMTSTLLALATLVILAAGPSRGEAPSTIYQATLQEPNQQTPEVSTEELRQILADQRAIVFDARPYQEYAVSHIPGARNVSAKPGVPMSEYVSDVAEIGRLVGPDKSTPILLYCNGPFCGKSKRLSAELVQAGYTHVRRYQLGIPVWRALGGLTEIELEGLRYVLAGDRTAVFIDARDPEEFRAQSLPGARNVPRSGLKPGKDVGEVKTAKDDGRLPMEDHNTRIVVFGWNGVQAKAVAEAIAQEAFHNVAYFGGTFEILVQQVAGK
jgi:rhodanese-related sulfurtransferase